jgi:hypothetical protein
MTLIENVVIVCRGILVAVILVKALRTKSDAEFQPLSDRLMYGIPLLLAFFLLFKGISNLPEPGTGFKQPIYPL